MKNTILLAVLCVLSACNLSRNVQQNKGETRFDSMTNAKEVVSKVESIVDTSRMENGKIKITEVEFFSPINYEELTSDKDVSKNLTQGVKNIKQIVIETNSEQKGKSQESNESKNVKSIADLSKSESSIQLQKESIVNHCRWRYLIYAALFVLALLLYLKRVPILNWLKHILLGILKRL